MTKESKYSKIALHIEKSLDTDGIVKQSDQIKDFEHFKELVARFVQQMMENDFERFLAVMYRMDVSELKLREAMNTENPLNVYLEIAELIIKREEQKIYWREKYRD